MLHGYGILNNHVPTLKATVMKIGAAISTLLTGLYAVYKAEGNNNLSLKNAWNGNGNAVDSKSGNDGTIATPSGTTWVPSTMTYGSGKLGSGAFTFSGSNFVTLPNGSLNFTADFSISAWIYVPTAFGTNISRIISCFDNQLGATTYRGWEVVYNNGTVRLQIYPSGANYYIISVPMTLKDQWVHITAVRINGQQGEIYINGSAGVKTVSSNGATSADAVAYNGVNNLAYIGALYDSGASPRYSVTPSGGFKIDSLQTWNGSALSSSAVTELYNSGNGQEYPFTLSSVMIPTANDALATYNGTAQGGLTYTAGKSGNAFTFNGTTSLVAIPNSSFDFTVDFSISTWVKIPSAPTAFAYIFSNYNYDFIYNYGYLLGVNTNRTIFFGVYSPSGTPSIVSTTVLALNTWYHVAVKRDTINKKSYLYVNGILEAQTSTSDGISIAYGTRAIQPTIGAQRNNNQGTLTTSNFLTGSVDELNIWNKQLTATEITELYNAGAGKFYPY